MKHNDDKQIMYYKEDKLLIQVLLIIVIPVILLLLILFTKPAILGIFDFSQTGQIGDTIGGISAPIIGLLAAFLIYKSFSVQINMNRIQKDAIMKQMSLSNETRNLGILQDFYKQVRDDFSDLYFIVEDNKRVHGKTALVRFHADLQNKSRYQPAIVNDLSYIITVLQQMLEIIERSEMESENKNLIYVMIDNFYSRKLSYHIRRIAIKCKIEQKFPRFIRQLSIFKDKMNDVKQITQESEMIFFEEIRQEDTSESGDI